MQKYIFSGNLCILLPFVPSNLSAVGNAETCSIGDSHCKTCSFQKFIFIHIGLPLMSQLPRSSVLWFASTCALLIGLGNAILCSSQKDPESKRWYLKMLCFYGEICWHRWKACSLVTGVGVVVIRGAFDGQALSTNHTFEGMLCFSLLSVSSTELETVGTDIKSCAILLKVNFWLICGSSNCTTCIFRWCSSNNNVLIGFLGMQCWSIALLCNAFY